MLQKFIPSADLISDKGKKTLAPMFHNNLTIPQLEDEVAVYTDGSNLDQIVGVVCSCAGEIKLDLV
jgi:hypothetical protein